MAEDSKRPLLVMHNVIAVVRSIMRWRKGNVRALETGTIRSYEEKHESTRHIAETLGSHGSLVSVDVSANAIRISKDICKHLSNIEWVCSKSVSYLKSLGKHAGFHFVFLDSGNNASLIFDEFRYVLPHIANNGVLMIDDAGLLLDGRLNMNGAKKAHKVAPFLQSAGIGFRINKTPGFHGTQLIIRMSPSVKMTLLDALQKKELA